MAFETTSHCSCHCVSVSVDGVKSRVQRTGSSLQHALPLYSLDHHRNDLAGEGSVVPVLYLQVVVLFSHSVMSDALQPHVAGSSVIHYFLEFAQIPVLRVGDAI